MQYVWQYRLWLPTDMRTVDGRRVEVLDPGLLNTAAGPDFFNAKLVIDGEHWVGNVEIHVRASDWFRHGHDKDMAYDSVVLHVVEHDDRRIQRVNGLEIPQIVMPCARSLHDDYMNFVHSGASGLRCGDYFKALPSVYVTDWMTALGFERLYSKAERVQQWKERCGGDWHQTLFVALARAFAFGTNGDSFEMLALYTPLKALLKHVDSLESMEAILFGQAGFLDDLSPELLETVYIRRLKDEYEFLSHKYGLRRPPAQMWKRSGMRPQSFPHRRIAALASLFYSNRSFLYSVLHCDSLDSARAMFDLPMWGYWTSHFNFGTQGSYIAKAFSMASINTLIINAVVPLMYQYGIETGASQLCERAVDIMQALPPEDNRYVRVFRSSGVQCRDAFGSQALIHLHTQYCDQRKCLFCRIGHRYLAQKAIVRDKKS